MIPTIRLGLVIVFFVALLSIPVLFYFGNSEYISARNICANHNLTGFVEVKVDNNGFWSPPTYRISCGGTVLPGHYYRYSECVRTDKWGDCTKKRYYLER